jgi:hypothetical protein
VIVSFGVPVVSAAIDLLLTVDAKCEEPPPPPAISRRESRTALGSSPLAREIVRMSVPLG